MMPRPSTLPSLPTPAAPAQRPPALPRAPRPAFTLIELLMVIAIIALISAISVPAISAISKDNSRAQAANLVRAKLSQARALAIAQGRPHGVVFYEESPKYALPVHGGQTAMQLFAEDFDQAQYNPANGNTVFVPLGGSGGGRDYLPRGIKLAALNDDATRGIMTGDESSPSVGRTRAILFDASGQMITRHGLARPDLGTAQPGTYPRALGDWNFTTKGGPAHLGMASPGILLYDAQEFAAAQISPDHAGDTPRDAWLKSHATVILVNANTGALLQ